MSAKRLPSSPWTSHISQSGFERSSRCEKIRPASWRSCSLRARLRQRGVAHVVVEVEARVVDPERPAHLEAAGRRASAGSAARAAAATRCARANSSRAGGGPSKITSAPTCMCERLLLLVRGRRRRPRSGGPCDPAAPREERTTRDTRVCEAAGDRARGTGRTRNRAGGARRHRQPAVHRRPRGGRPDAARRAAVSADRFDGAAAFRLLRRQVELGPRPAGSPESRRLARLLSGSCRAASYQEVPGGLRNVVGTVPRPRAGLRGGGRPLRHQGHPRLRGRQRRRLRHGRRGPARPHASGAPAHTVKFVFFDGEESPRGTPDREFEKKGLRGQQGRRQALRGRTRDGAARLRRATAGSRIHYEEQLEPGPVAEAAQRRPIASGALEVFPRGDQGPVSDDHLPFLEAGRALDRPDRLRLPLLAPPLRRHVRRLASAA